MLVLCLCYACVILVLCLCYACVILVLCLCYACVMLVLCLCYAFVMIVLCLCYACVMLVLYLCYACVMLVLCLCYACVMLVTTFLESSPPECAEYSIRPIIGRHVQSPEHLRSCYCFRIHSTLLSCDIFHSVALYVVYLQLNTINYLNLYRIMIYNITKMKNAVLTSAALQVLK